MLGLYEFILLVIFVAVLLFIVLFALILGYRENVIKHLSSELDYKKIIKLENDVIKYLEDIKYYSENINDLVNYIYSDTDVIKELIIDEK